MKLGFFTVAMVATFAGLFDTTTAVNLNTFADSQKTGVAGTQPVAIQLTPQQMQAL